MTRKRILPLLLWLMVSAALILGSACTPNLTREQLTPSPTIATLRPTRTSDPRQQIENLATPDATRAIEAAATLLPAVSSIGPLLIEEFPLAREEAASLQPGAVEENQAFADSLPEEIRSNHLDIGSDAVNLEEANAALASAGYRLEQAGGRLRLTQDGKTVEDCVAPDAFRTWEDGWVLELDGDVLMDGERLTERHGFDQVFNWQAPAGQEMFLFQQGDEYGIFFDGRPLPLTYDEIVRWNCQDQQRVQGFNFSARGSDEVSGFFARKGDRWYYVRITTLE